MNQIEEEEIKPLLFNYVLHSILFILNFILHVILCLKIYWTSMVNYKLFIFGTCFFIIYAFFSFLPIYYIIERKFKLNKIRMVAKLSLILIIITFIISLLISLVLLLNAFYSKSFYKECPFNLSLSHLNAIFSSYYGKSAESEEIKDECKSRRCVLDSSDLDEDYPYKYLCNYDPTFEINDDDKIYKRTQSDGTEIVKDEELVCSEIVISHNDYSFKNSILYDYLDLCYYISDFYYCKRLNKHKNFDVEFNILCPDNTYIFLLFLFSALFVIIDLIVSVLPWIVEIISLRKLERILSTGRVKANSHNSTAKSSVISNNPESFEKENTLIIISPLNVEPIQDKNNENSRNKNVPEIKDSKNPLIIFNNPGDDIKENKNKKSIYMDNSSERIDLKKNSNDNQINNNNTIQNSNVIKIFSKNENNVNVDTDFKNAPHLNKLNVRDKIQSNNNDDK